MLSANEILADLQCWSVNLDPLESCKIMELYPWLADSIQHSALEKFYFYRETQRGNQISDKQTVQSNPIFKALIQNNPDRGQ